MEGMNKMRFVTDEAIYAVQSAAVGSGKSAISIYLGKRVFAFIMTGVVIYILLTGNVSLIVNVVLNFISGLIKALEGLGK